MIGPLFPCLHRSPRCPGRPADPAVLVLAGIVAVSPSGLAGQDERAYQVLESADERYQALSTLCARFHQEIEVTLLGETRTGEGRLCRRQPAEFSMRFSDPEGDLVVVDGELQARPMMYLALTYDHRIVDGREAVQFLVAIKELLEDPARLLLQV